ncbi:hypothetical protein F3Y22_tig00111582pilonHSYRG00743 [Hibiscus syriacus]|uniref:Reverse transcriptase n=1 Tax=Hibiscus syriacus TaxID=106335 RepID=A0A6A2Y0Q7_HIBSY|nr:hypothetical protein F3Y22_tig00111582pilonHSYRG00743 [Hibiscus syriacus]
MHEMERLLKLELEPLQDRMDQLEASLGNRRVNCPRMEEELEEEEAEVISAARRDVHRNHNDNFNNIKVTIPPFQGRTDPESYLDWVIKIEHIFECQNYTEQKKVRLAAMEFVDYALVWWDQLVSSIRRNGERPITTWEEMKAIMRKSKSVEDYFKEMEIAMIRANVDEDREATMARLLSGLNLDIANLVELQHYSKFDHQIEARAYYLPETNFSPIKGSYRGHVASECPNRNVMMLLANGDIVSDSDEPIFDEEPETIQEEEAEENVDHGEMLVSKRCLQSQTSQDDIQRNNIFHTRCHVKDKVCTMIIDGGSCTNVASTLMVEKLGLATSKHPMPYKLQWLNEGGELNVTKQVLIPFSVGRYKDEVLCDIVPMHASHILLGRPWQYDKRLIHDCFHNQYTFKHDGCKDKSRERSLPKGISLDKDHSQKVPLGKSYSKERPKGKSYERKSNGKTQSFKGCFLLAKRRDAMQGQNELDLRTNCPKEGGMIQARAKMRSSLPIRPSINYHPNWRQHEVTQELFGQGVVTRLSSYRGSDGDLWQARNGKESGWKRYDEKVGVGEGGGGQPIEFGLIHSDAQLLNLAQRCLAVDYNIDVLNHPKYTEVPDFRLKHRGVISRLRHRGAQSSLAKQRFQLSIDAQRHRGDNKLKRMLHTHNGGSISSHREEIEAALVDLRAYMISGDRMKRVKETQEDLLEIVTDLGNEARDAIGVIQLGEGVRAKIPDPQRFDGARDAKEIENFLFDIVQYFWAIHTESEEDKVAMALMYLGGDAKLWRRSKFKDGVCSIMIWDALKKELKTSFLPENVYYNAHKKLRELSHTGTTREYVREFSTLMLDIKDMLERDKLFYFLEGLKSWARFKLQRQKVQDLTVAIAATECLNHYNDHPGKCKTSSKSGVNTQQVGENKLSRGEKTTSWGANRRFLGRDPAQNKVPTSPESSNTWNKPSLRYFLYNRPHRVTEYPQRSAFNAMVTSIKDGERSQLSNLRKEPERGLMYMDISINGKTSKALVDTGATYTFISPEETKRCGLIVTKELGQMKTINSNTSTICGGVKRVSIKLGSWEGSVDFTISHMDDFDMVLWLDFMMDVMPDELSKELPSRRSVDHEIELIPGVNSPAKALNKVTFRNKYLIPLIAYFFDKLSNAKYFTKLDLRLGYHQVRVVEGDEPKMTSVTWYGAFEFLIMPFGLTNAPATLCTLMNQVFHDYLDKFVVIYLDDIMIFSTSMEEHQEHLRLVLPRLQENQLFVKNEKCAFAQTQVQFLGHVIEQGRIRMDKEKVKAIQKRFVEGYSRRVKLLTDLLKKGCEWVWSKDFQEAFDELKKVVISEPVLTLSNLEKPLEVETDRSDYAIGGNQFADALSRRVDLAALRCVAPISASRVSNEIRHLIVNFSKQDPQVVALMKMVKKGISKCFWIENGLLMTKGPRMFVPRAGNLRQKLLKECHDTPWVGHPGWRRTVAFLGQGYYWPQIRQDVMDYPKTCLICQQDKVDRHRIAGLLEPLSVPARPWESISLDFISRLPRGGDLDQFWLAAKTSSYYGWDLSRKMPSCLKFCGGVEAEYGDWQGLLGESSEAFLSQRDRCLVRKFEGLVSIVAEVGNASYKVDPPTWMRVHSVFHVSNLKSFHTDPNVANQSIPVRESIGTQPPSHRHVEEILAGRIVKGWTAGRVWADPQIYEIKADLAEKRPFRVPHGLTTEPTRLNKSNERFMRNPSDSLLQNHVPPVDPPRLPLDISPDIDPNIPMMEGISLVTPTILERPGLPIENNRALKKKGRNERETMQDEHDSAEGNVMLVESNSNKIENGGRENPRGMSYAGVVAGSFQQRGAMEKVPCMDDVVVEEADVIIDTSGQIPSVEFSENVHERIDHSIRRSIIVRLLRRKIGYKMLLDRIQLLWKPKGRLQVVDLDSDYYIVMFEIEEDYNHFLSDGPWTVYGSYLIVQPWSRTFTTAEKFPSQVVKIDYNTLAGDRGKFVRLAVMVNLNKPLIPSIRIDGIVRQLEYEGLQQIYCTCGT